MLTKASEEKEATTKNKATKEGFPRRNWPPQCVRRKENGVEMGKGRR